AIGLRNLKRSPKRAAIGLAHRGPKNIAFGWRPWPAVKAVDGDGAENFDHGAPPAPCSAAMRSSAAPSGPDGRPCESRDKARRIISGSAPHRTAIENTIAESRALVSAALLLLWLLRKTSASRPSLKRPTVQV